MVVVCFADDNNQWVQPRFQRFHCRSGLGTSKQAIRAKLVGALEGKLGENGPTVDVATHGGFHSHRKNNPIAEWFLNVYKWRIPNKHELFTATISYHHFRKPPHVDLIQSRNSGRTAYLYTKIAVFQLAVQHLQESVKVTRKNGNRSNMIEQESTGNSQSLRSIPG